MPKEVLIYGQINEHSSSEFIDSINELEANDDLVVRVNTSGGSPEYGFGMVAKYAEFSGNKILKIDGKAFSMGLFFVVYADSSEALDVSEFLIHRAAYPAWFEKDPEFFTEELRGNLARNNKNLETAFRNKVDVAKFEALKGVKVKDIFSMEGRIDVFLSAKEARDIGLIDKIIKITPAKKAEIESTMIEMAAKYGENVNKPVTPVAEVKPDKLKKMTKEEFKASNPEAYNEIFNAGVKTGSDNEKARIDAWMVFADVDIEAVQKGIESGAALSARDTAELSRKSLNIEAVAKIERDSEGNIVTGKTAATAEEAKKKEEADFLAEVLTPKS